MTERTTKFTNTEFAALPRYTDEWGGRCLKDLGSAFMWLTDSQIAKLDNDDQSRLDEYQEEVRCLWADAKAEFGL